ncbi:hypothetical protein I6F14_23950 [Bradyrhizobium sp. IC3069]|uniref:hypothetical protein n=1 Tax=Bradyrhizobium TaxID=374 RepID=UPI001CD75424|nr:MULTISPECIES: hypothetical protein [Bradyrhizobium]MCA1363451.1 hypothetical protein [Bradyrhizobium sp. IC4059]MCA1411079.1 hypothetical protein [Bradyrhizobium sp. NBAIM20]MCA1463923.1 hypothetical protein [Bradyrhizobium sp. NBAIM18]MCA1520990.1 hypothetical protein [Bradyrhizobium sp. IC3069]MCA1528693.1 hypothetical protein [Bradyrhizobium yuanmingense]
MDRFNTINPADRESTASDGSVEQPQQPHVAFEQHLAGAREAGPVYPHAALYDVTDEDDRLIQAASAAALDRGPPPSKTTVEIYDRRLRKLADALKKSGKSISGLDDDTLAGYAKKLLPGDKVIAPALSMVSQYRDPDADAGPISTHYRPSREDERLIRKAANAGFGRRIGKRTAESYASHLRKLAVALRPLSMAELSDDRLLGHADKLFPKDKTLVAALNGLRDYRATTLQNNLGGEGGSSRQVIQPSAPSPMPPADGHAMGSVADGGGSLPPGFDVPQVRHALGLAAHSPIQSVAQDELFDAADRENLVPASTFDAPVPWPTMSPTIPSPVQGIAQEELFDAADRENLLPTPAFDAPAPWPMMNLTIPSPVQSVSQEELFDAADRENLLLVPPFKPVPWPTMSLTIPSPVQSVAQEELFDAADRENLLPAPAFDAPGPWPTMTPTIPSPVQGIAQEALFDAATWQPSSRQPNSASEDHPRRMMDQGAAAQTTLEQTFAAAGDAFDASLSVPEDFSHGTQAAPNMMHTLRRWGLLPDAAQRIKTYDIRGERYIAVLGPGGLNDVRLVHLRSPAVGDTFDVSFAVPENFSHRTQLAPDMMLSTLGDWDFLPVAKHPIMNYEIGGERYTAILGPEGPKDVQLIHHPRPASPGEATPSAPRTSSDIYGGLPAGFDSPAPFEWREDPPSALAQSLSLPSAAPASGHQPFPQVPELGELLGDDWTHGPQEASPAVIDILQILGLLPSRDVPMTMFLIHGQRYTAESLAGGGVLLFHRP